MADDIIATIDALIDEQLAQGEPIGGHDVGDPGFPTCPHCERDWHGFPLTDRVAEMYFSGLFDEGYRVHGDDSSVLCPGSNAYGPARAVGPSKVSIFMRSLLARDNFVMVNIDINPQDWV